MRYVEGKRCGGAAKHKAALPEVGNIFRIPEEKSGVFNDIITAEVGSTIGARRVKGAGVYLL